jgi:ERCC4-type nuclease
MLKYKEENPTVQLIYIVENFTLNDNIDYIINPSAPPKNQKTIKVLLSAIVSTMLRDHFYVMTTQSFDGTVALIERIYEKWPSYKLKNVKTEDHGTTEYLKNIKIAKKDNLDPCSWYIRSLAQIPGISVEKATVIQGVYPTFSLLLDKYKHLPDTKSCENMLKDLVCGTRKLGPVCSKRVYQYVLQQPNV